MKLALGCLVVLVAGCGDNIVVTPDASPPRFMTAPHTPLPLALPHNNVILDHVKLVTITYGNYDPASQLMVEAFGDAIVGSSWLTTVGTEYGVGTGTHAAKVHIGNAPTTTLEDVQLVTLIESLVTANTVPMPPATGNEYLYMIYVPPSVPLGASLQGIYGYHAMATVNGINFPFAVILDDGTPDHTTTTASHELIEAATDPLFVTNPNGDGWYTDPAVPDPWNLILGEVGDLCNNEPPEHDSGFAVQRSWSNAEAAAGRGPCIPTHGDKIWMTVTADPATMPTIAPGAAATFTLTGWSTQEIGDWTIATATADYSDLTDTQMIPQLSATTINNATTVTLTLHAPTNATSGAHGGVYILSGPYQRPWAVGFTVQ